MPLIIFESQAAEIQSNNLDIDDFKDEESGGYRKNHRIQFRAGTDFIKRRQPENN